MRLATAAIIVLLVPALPAQVDRQQILDYLERVRDDAGVPGLAAAVSLDGEIVFSGGSGRAELDNGTPYDGRTVNNIGSISKVVATVGLMKLVEEGKIDLDAALQTYLPYYPEKKWPVTLRHVLTHSSGTRHYDGVEFGKHRTGAMRRYDSFEEATKIWRDSPLLYKPGSAWSYSSHAFNLLHGFIEKASGESFEDYLRLNVFEPAGMLATQFDVPTRVIHGRGHGYERDDQGRIVHTIYEDPSFKYAGGGILASMEDLVRFADAINRGVLLKPEIVQTMLTPQLGAEVMTFADDPKPLAFRQAIGWRISELRGHAYSSHGGSVKGVKTFLGNFAEEGLIVALQGNERSFNPQKPALAIAQRFLPPVSR